MTTVREALREVEAIYEEWEKRAIDKGRQDGLEAGREVLLEQLAQRFGEVPEPERKRIEQAELDDLKRWTKRVIPASTMADVFKSE